MHCHNLTPTGTVYCHPLCQKKYYTDMDAHMKLCAYCLFISWLVATGMYEMYCTRLCDLLHIK